ncbi:MAG TPA: hypothetical protein VH951_03150 [Dehalococcoidia bacterium]
MIALVAGVVAWAMSRGKKSEEEQSEAYAAPVSVGATPDTSPSEG